MAQGAEFPLKKPPGFHYDFFLLGITTFIAGLLGLPAPNGLIPQAPIHTTSLLVYGKSPRMEKDEEDRNSTGSRTRSSSQNSRNEDAVRLSASHGIDEIPVAVVEQRVSNLAQGSLCLVLLSGPFLHHVLALIPRGVLAGLLYVVIQNINRLLTFFKAGTWVLQPCKEMESPKKYSSSSRTKR